MRLSKYAALCSEAGLEANVRHAAPDGNVTFVWEWWVGVAIDQLRPVLGFGTSLGPALDRAWERIEELQRRAGTERTLDVLRRSDEYVRTDEAVHGTPEPVNCCAPSSPPEPTVEIGGQVMTQAQYDAARFPLLVEPTTTEAFDNFTLRGKVRCGAPSASSGRCHVIVGKGGGRCRWHR